MPIYEYECACCASRFELKKGFDDVTPVSCPKCGGDTQRVFSPVPIIFKGSGFYVTDNRGNHDSPSLEGNHEQSGVGSVDGGG